MARARTKQPNLDGSFLATSSVIDYHNNKICGKIVDCAVGQLIGISVAFTRLCGWGESLIFHRGTMKIRWGQKALLGTIIETTEFGKISMSYWVQIGKLL